MKMTETREGIVIEVFVKPNCANFEVSVEGDEIIIRSTEEPIKGKVNKEILKELTRLFHYKVEMVSGVSSKQKKLLIKNAKKSDVEQLLNANR